MTGNTPGRPLCRFRCDYYHHHWEAVIFKEASQIISFTSRPTHHEHRPLRAFLNTAGHNGSNLYPSDGRNHSESNYLATDPMSAARSPASERLSDLSGIFGCGFSRKNARLFASSPGVREMVANGGATCVVSTPLTRILVVGACAVLRRARQQPEKYPWLTQLLARRPFKVVAVALANKMARIAWALLAKGGTYRAPALAAAA